MRHLILLFLFTAGSLLLSAQPLWERKIGPPTTRVITHALAELPGGDLAVAGLRDNPDRQRPEATVSRYTATGDLRWTVAFTDRRQGLTAHALHVLPDDELLVTATRTDGELVLIRLDADGRERARVRPAAGSTYAIYQTLTLQNGDLLLGGQGLREDRSSFALLRLNAALEVVWSRNFINLDSEEPTYCERILEYPNGDLLAMGRSGGRYSLFRLSADNDLLFGRSSPSGIHGGVRLGEWYLSAEGTAVVPGSYPATYPGRLAWFHIDDTGNFNRTATQRLFAFNQQWPVLDQLQRNADGTYQGISINEESIYRLELDADGALLDSIGAAGRLEIDFEDAHRTRLLTADGGYAVVHTQTDADRTATYLHRYDDALRLRHRIPLGSHLTDTDDELAYLAVAPDGTCLSLYVRDSLNYGAIHSPTGELSGSLEPTEFPTGARVNSATYLHGTWWVIMTLHGLIGEPYVYLLQAFDDQGKSLNLPLTLPNSPFFFTNNAPHGASRLHALANGNILVQGYQTDVICDSQGRIIRTLTDVIPTLPIVMRRITPDRSGGYFNQYTGVYDGTGYISHYRADGSRTAEKTILFEPEVPPILFSGSPAVSHQLFYGDHGASLQIATHHYATDSHHHVSFRSVDETSLTPGPVSNRIILPRNGNFSYYRGHTPFRLEPVTDGYWIHTSGESVLYGRDFTVRYSFRHWVRSNFWITYPNDDQLAAKTTNNARYYIISRLEINDQTDLQLTCYGLEDYTRPEPLLADTTIQVSLYPNPAALQSNLYLNDASRGSIQLELFDATGRSHWREQREKEQDIFEQAVPVARLPKGTYWLRVLTETGSTTHPLLVE